MDGYGYQWRVNPACCRADAVEAGDVPVECPSTCWFWLLAAGVGLVAAFAPKKRGAR
jgi:hypothetical protein